MYLPFASIAKAFGVPDSNIKQSGNILRMYFRSDWFGTYILGSNEVQWAGNWGPSKKSKLEAPVKIKNGIVMVTSSDIYGTLFSGDTGKDTLIKAFQEPSSGGIISGKPYLACSPAKD